MTNYDLITNKEYKYLTYICEELQKVHDCFLKCVTDRDVKLSLVLRDDFSDGYNSAIETISKIKEQINNLDVYQLASAELEDIGAMIENLIKYYEYFEGVSKTVNSI
jgi:hypothetical protein